MSSLHSPVPLVSFGITQVLCGIGMIITDIVYFCLLGTYAGFLYSFFASGLYLGAFFVITGSFGINAGRPLSTGVPPQSRKCVLITSMVLSILSMFPSVAVIVLVLLTYWGTTALALVSPITFYFHVIVSMAHLAQSISAAVNLCKMPNEVPVSKMASAQSFYCIPGFSAGVPMTVFTQQSLHGGVASLYPTLTAQPAFRCFNVTTAASQMGRPLTNGAPVSERNNTFTDIPLKS